MLCLFRMRHVAYALLIQAALLSPQWTHAAGAELTLAEALARVLRASPDLKPFAFQMRAREAERLQAGLLPNPELDVTMENFAGSGPLRGSRAQETTLSLSQLVELGGKRGRRQDLAEAALGRTAADFEIARLDALVETTRRYIDVAQAQAEADLLRESSELARQTAAAVERRIQAGAASTAERNRAAIATLRAKLDEQRAAGQLDAQRLALAAMWGADSTDFARVSGLIEVLPPLQAFPRIVERLQDGAEARRFVEERRLRDAELRLAESRAIPDVTFGLGVRRLNGGPDNALVASLSLPLPLFNRNQGEVDAARARQLETDAERDAALVRARTVLYRLHQSAAQARRLSAALRGEALTQARQALALTQRGFANGRYSLVELADVQRQVVELRSQAIVASADAHRLDTEIERLSGHAASLPAQDNGVKP